MGETRRLMSAHVPGEVRGKGREEIVDVVGATRLARTPGNEGQGQACRRGAQSTGASVLEDGGRV